MRKGILGSLAVLTAGAGLAFGQPKTPPKGPTGPSTFPPPGMVPPGPMGPPGLMTPDGQPFLAPGGMEGMVPPGAMYGDPGMGMDQGDPNQQGAYGSGNGMLGGIFGREGPPRFWFGADYLLWVPRSLTLRYPIVTTSAAPDLGVVGRPTTASLGPLDRNIAFDTTTGLRPYLGFALGESGELGAEFSGFWVEPFSRDFNFGANGIGLPTLAIPFLDTNTLNQGSYIVSSPGINTGTIRVKVESRVLGGEANLVYNAYNSGASPGGLTLLAGARFVELRESFQLDTISNTFGVPPLGGPALGSSFFPGGGGFFSGAFFGPAFAPYNATTTDYIRTTNDFYGGQVGFKGDIGYGNYFLNLTGKVGAGYMRQYADLQGSTTFGANNVRSNQAGGLLNLPQDLYRHRRDQLAYLGEGNINVGYQVGSFLRFQAGYTFMWMSNVLRPTTTISQDLNPNLIPISPTFNGAGPAVGTPRDVVADTDYHLSGFNFGIQLSF